MIYFSYSSNWHMDGAWGIMAVSPDVLFARSRFARSMKSFRPDWESILILMLVGAFFRTRNIHTTVFRLFICVRLIIRSIRKNLELDLFFFIVRSSRKILGWNDFHTPGKSTLSPGETPPGEQDTGRNDLLPCVRFAMWKHMGLRDRPLSGSRKFSARPSFLWQCCSVQY